MIQKTYFIQHTVHTHSFESQTEQQNTFKQTWAFLVSSVPSLEVLSLKEGWPTSGSQAGEAMVQRRSYAAELAGESTCRRDEAPPGAKGAKAEGAAVAMVFATCPEL